MAEVAGAWRCLSVGMCRGGQRQTCRRSGWGEEGLAQLCVQQHTSARARAAGRWWGWEVCGWCWNSLSSLGAEQLQSPLPLLPTPHGQAVEIRVESFRARGEQDAGVAEVWPVQPAGVALRLRCWRTTVGGLPLGGPAFLQEAACCQGLSQQSTV